MAKQNTAKALRRRKKKKLKQKNAIVYSPVNIKISYGCQRSATASGAWSSIIYKTFIRIHRTVLFVVVARANFFVIAIGFSTTFWRLLTVRAAQSATVAYGSRPPSPRHLYIFAYSAPTSFPTTTAPSPSTWERICRLQRCHVSDRAQIAQRRRSPAATIGQPDRVRKSRARVCGQQPPPTRWSVRLARWSPFTFVVNTFLRGSATTGYRVMLCSGLGHHGRSGRVRLQRFGVNIAADAPARAHHCPGAAAATDDGRRRRWRRGCQQ